jgi:hypothetical protein
MDGDSTYSGCDTHHHVGGDPDPDPLSELERGIMGDWMLAFMGELLPVDLDSVWPMEHLLRCLSRAGVLIECRLLLEEDPPNLVQSFLRAIISMTLLSALIRWFWLGRLFAQRVNVETQGSRGYSWHHSDATAAILVLFGAAKYFCTKNADSKLSYKYKDIQSKYVGNLDKLKLFRKHMEVFDMFDPYLIPTWINPDAISVLDFWGDRKHDEIDLTKHWPKLFGYSVG